MLTPWLQRAVLVAGAIFVALVAYLGRQRLDIVAIVPTSLSVASMDYSDINDALVTASNPARSDGSLDHARCAALHNYLLRHGWLAGGRAEEDLENHHGSFFSQHGDEAEELRSRLDPSVIAFLESVRTPMEPSAFYFWVGGIADPESMFFHAELLSYHYEADADMDRFLTLYDANLEHGPWTSGLIYDQRRHRATVSLHIDNFDFAMPPEQHEDLWFPLETVLSNWIEMTRLGKITAVPEDSEIPNFRIGVWSWNPYSPAQVDGAVAALDRLTAAIEERMPAGSLPVMGADGEGGGGPMLSDAELDAALVPDECFIRSVLTRARAPRFRTIAPGLLVPQGAAAAQPFTAVDTSSQETVVIPPVLIFPAAGGRTVNFDSSSPYTSLNPFGKLFSDAVPKGDHSTPAGLYSEAVERWSMDYAEEGFKLLLPFAVQRDVAEGQARTSDRSVIDRNCVADLFQHGFKPFGGEPYRSQRLERLLDRWRELVETGVWSVGAEGVQGTIDAFRDADSARWKDYWIAPTW